MTATSESMDCNKKCWIMAAIVGLIVAILMLIGGYSALPALFIGVVAFFLVGLLLTWLLCMPAERARTTIPTEPVAAETLASAAAVSGSSNDHVADSPDDAEGPAPAPQKVDITPAQADAAVAAAGPAKVSEDADREPDAAAVAIPDYDGDGVHEGTDEGMRPATLDGPRDGQADDLKKIKGVGPKLEQLLQSMGFYHFDQIAGWSAQEIAWVDANLKGFKGRVSRGNWVEQASLLAAGGETAFSKKVDKGGVY